MKIAILANDRASFYKPLAEGLFSMLKRINISSQIFYEGTDALNFPINTTSANIKFQIKNTTKKLFNFIGFNYYISKNKRFELLVNSLKNYNAIILVGHMPATFAKNHYTGIELLRETTDIPILNYDLCFLPTRGSWLSQIQTDEQYGGFTGLNRFDYYLVTSVVSEFPLKEHIKFPFSCIGIDIRSLQLMPEQQEFTALIDFQQNEFLAEREIQIAALNETNTPFIELSGSYSAAKIREIYRKTSMIFLAHRESFGLPIVELQLCGAYVATPYKKWAPSHYINKSIYEPGEGDLGKNFLIYHNNKDILKKLIVQIKGSYDSAKVITNLKDQYPHLYSGNLEELENVVIKLKTGYINHQSHTRYTDLDKEIVTAI